MRTVNKDTRSGKNVFVEWTVFRNGSIFGGEKVKGDTEKGKIASLNGRALTGAVSVFPTLFQLISGPPCVM